MPTPDDLDAPLYERLPGEPALWYGRFQTYRDVGPSRSLRGTYRAEMSAEPGQSLPRSWVQAIARWRWRERAAAYDDDVLASRDLAWKERAEALRQERIAILNEFTRRVERAVSMLVPDTARWGDVVGALHVLMQQTRAEFEPKERSPGRNGGTAEIEWSLNLGDPLPPLESTGEREP